MNKTKTWVFFARLFAARAFLGAMFAGLFAGSLAQAEFQPLDAPPPARLAGEIAWSAGNYAEAVAHWQQLVERSADTPSSIYLGYAHLTGKGVSYDPAASFRYYARAAERGDPAAQYALGLAYELGRGVEQDIVEAEYWYGLAVAQDFCPGELSASGGLAEW